MVIKTEISSKHVLATTFRIVFINKLNLVNSYRPLFIKQVALSLTIGDLEDFDTSRLVASAFILRLLSSQQAYALCFNIFKTFRTSNYDMTIRVNLTGEKIFFFYDTFIGGIIPYLSKTNSHLSFSLVNSLIVAKFAIYDFNFIRLVETHSAFFRWHDKVNIMFYSNSVSLDETKLFIKFLKFYR